MKFTLKEDFDIKLVARQHEILLQATALLEGREGVLETEKELYLILAIVGSMVKEDIVGFCNNSDKDLLTLMTEEIEPYFRTLLGEQIPVDVYMEMKFMLLNRCREIWDNQHSAMGVINTILTGISLLSDEDKKQVLTETAKLAEQAYDRRTEKIAQSTEATNAKIQSLIEQYKGKIENDTK